MVEYVSDAARAAGIEELKLMNLQLAVEEVAVNVCNYAYPSPPGEVTIRHATRDGRFLVEIVDQGIPFDPLSLPAPDTSLDIEERHIGGLGIFFVRRVMNEVRYEREGDRNHLTLIMDITAPAGD